MAKTKYDKETFPQIAEDLARQGLIDEDIAKKLGISKDTFYTYIKKFPEFSDALKRGKAPIDFEVESALLKRALGYSYEEKKTTRRKVQSEDGGESDSWVIDETVTVKEVVPDTTAQIFWLKNRRPKQWRDKQEIDHTTKGESIQPTIINLGEGIAPTTDKRYNEED